MAISYPLTFPAYSYVEQVRWQSVDAVGISQSPYTFSQQVYDYQSAFWVVDIDLRFLSRAEAMPVVSFINKLRGQRGTFSFYDVINAAPLGSPSGSPKVNGASQTGFSLVTDGWPNSTNNLLKEGDRIQIENSLYRVLSNVNSNGSGQATIDVWPHLKSHPDNSDIITTNPKGLFRLDAGTQIVDLIDRNKLYQITLSAIEAI